MSDEKEEWEVDDEGLEDWEVYDQQEQTEDADGEEVTDEAAANQPAGDTDDTHEQDATLSNEDDALASSSTEVGQGSSNATAMNAAEADSSASAGLADAAIADTKVAPLNEFSQANSEALGLKQDLDVILDIPVKISMEVGSTQLSIRNLIQLNQGSVIELDRLAGEPLDVMVNGTLIAQGEVVVVNEKFGIRITDVVSPSERLKKLK